MKKHVILLLALAFTAAFAAFSDVGEETRLLKERAEAGDPESIYILATLYDRGFDSIPVDSIRSTELYLLAADKGYLPAMNYIGYRLLSGEYSGLPKDADAGLKWLEKAAVMGDSKAASNLGWLLTEGRYVEKDLEKARFWLEKASEAGLPVAQSMLGDIYRDGRGVPADSAMADSLYREAFDRGLADAAYKLADLEKERLDTLSAPELVKEGLYYYLRNAPSIGVKLFYRAADLGSPEALALLGDAYTRAIGVPYDHDLSLTYFVKAALAGDPSAQFVLGELLEIFPDTFDSPALREIKESPGISAETLEDPFYWYERAASAGITDAETATARLLNP